MHIIRSQHPQTWPKLIWERAQTKRKTIEVKKWNISKIQHIYRIQIGLKIHFKTPRCPVDLAAVRLAVAQFPKIQWRRPPANYSIRSQCNLHCLKGLRGEVQTKMVFWLFQCSNRFPGIRNHWDQMLRVALNCPNCQTTALASNGQKSHGEIWLKLFTTLSTGNCWPSFPPTWRITSEQRPNLWWGHRWVSTIPGVPFWTNILISLTAI